MSNRFARPTLATLDRYRSERDTLLRAARANYDGLGGARRTLGPLARAREQQRKVLWARKVLGAAAITPVAGLGTPGGRP